MGKKSREKVARRSPAGPSGPLTVEEIQRKFPGAPSRWGDMQSRMNKDGTPDALRRELLTELATLTHRSVVVYATAFHVPAKVMLGNAQLLSLVLGDISGMREMIADLPTGPLDLVLHTPGGSAEAAEGIVSLLRTKFTDVRVLVPLAAKSAGTMLAASANQIITLPGAELGPIDPQFVVQGRFAPAKAIENQFDRAAEEIVKDPKRIPTWVPLLSSLGPSMLEECRKALELSKGLVSRWLADYMFAGDPEAKEKAAIVANYLSDYELHMSHGRRIGVEELRSRGVKINYASEVDAKLDDVLSRLWIALELTLSNTNAYKVIENNRGQSIYANAQIEARKVGP